MWVTKKQLKHQIAVLESDLDAAQNEVEELVDILKKMYQQFPLAMGAIVYDVQLRSATGRFTRTKVSKEHSFINEVTVTEKNYFNLVNRYNNKDVFLSLCEAEEFIDTICVE